MDKPEEIRPFSDHDKLAWESMRAPLQSSVDALMVAAQAIQNTVANLLMETAGLKAEDGWAVNIEKRRFERRPAPKEEE